MKKSILYLFSVTVIAMLMASCSMQAPTLVIKKRHFNKGYYVSVNHKNKPVTAQERQEIVAEPQEEKAAEQALAKPVNADDAIAISASDPKTEKAVPLVSAQNKLASAKPLQTFKPLSLKELTQIKTVSEQYKSAKNSDNHSLLWTIIVILLLLWLLGILMGGWGLGGLLHTILVIAIILLILMLLGII